MNQGQITINTRLGKWIYTLAKHPIVNTILEVGTWWGLGSTNCIKQGLLERAQPIKIGYSIECVKERYNKAINNLAPLPPNFYLLYGSVVSYAELQSQAQVPTTKARRQYFKDDMEQVRVAPFIGNPLQGTTIDLCILDGSEFTGLIEFFRLGIYSRYVVLDDTTKLKHSATRDYVLSRSNDWRILEDAPNERNGHLVCERCV